MMGPKYRANRQQFDRGAKGDLDGFVVAGDLVALAYEALDFADILKDLFGDDGRAGDFILHARAGAANSAPQDEGDRDDDRHQHDDEERQAPVQVEHDRNRADQRQRLLQKAADIAGQNRANDGDIG